MFGADNTEETGTGLKALVAKDLYRSFGGGKEGAVRKVLNGFSLKMEMGAFEALMGPSGSGKTTFLHIAAGLLRADSGYIETACHDMGRMSDAEAAEMRRRGIGLVFQDFNLFEDMTVRDNILYPLRLDRVKPDPSRFDMIVESTGLTERIHRKCSLLSGGERQRVAIARALMHKPTILLADEPTGNLDCSTTSMICLLLKYLNVNDDCAILVVTHDPAVAARTNKVHFMRDGELVASCETKGSSARVSQLYLENCL